MRQQDVEHVAADDPQRAAHVGRLVEVLGQVLADERGAAGADRDDLADEPLVEQLPGAGHGVGEAHVVADLRDRPGCLGGLGQLTDVGQRGAAGLLDEHGLAGVEDAQGQRDHVLALRVHHHRGDALVGEDLVGGDRREVVLVGEVLQPRVVVGGGHHLHAVDLPERADPRRGVWMGDAQESYDDGLGHVLLLCSVGGVWCAGVVPPGGAPVQAGRRGATGPGGSRGDHLGGALLGEQLTAGPGLGRPVGERGVAGRIGHDGSPSSGSAGWSGQPAEATRASAASSACSVAVRARVSPSRMGSCRYCSESISTPQGPR